MFRCWYNSLIILSLKITFRVEWGSWIISESLLSSDCGTSSELFTLIMLSTFRDRLTSISLVRLYHLGDEPNSMYWVAVVKSVVNSHICNYERCWSFEKRVLFGSGSVEREHRGVGNSEIGTIVQIVADEARLAVARREEKRSCNEHNWQQDSLWHENCNVFDSEAPWRLTKISACACLTEREGERGVDACLAWVQPREAALR